MGERAPNLAVDRVGDNVIVRTNFGHDRRIVLGGHLDTVPANGNEVPRRDGDTLHGLGAADMKGGLAVMLTLADALSSNAAKARFDATLVFYEAEEIAEEFNGLRRLFAERPDLVAGDLAVLLEPTGGWMEAGCQGTLHVRATFRGARAHSARPWMGTNAIHRASEVLARLAAYEADTVDVDGLDYRESAAGRAHRGRRREQRGAGRVLDRGQPALRPRVHGGRGDGPGGGPARRGRRDRRDQRVAGRAAQPVEPAGRRADRHVRPGGTARSSGGPTSPASPRTGCRR